MSVRDDFLEYWDGNGLVAPNPVPAGTKQGSDNSPMFTSEYYIMLKKNNQIIFQDLRMYPILIKSCIGLDNELHRAPNELDQPDTVDDYYGVYSGMKNLHLKPTFKLPLRLWRQPQLAAAMISAKFPSFINPVDFCIRLVAMPLFLIAAITLLISCINTPIDNTDARRLSWHLWQATKSTSLMCYLAGKVWLKRLYKDYPNGMKGVAAIYYKPSPDNPYSKWWITD